MIRKVILFVICAVLLGISITATAQTVVRKGAGATLPYPLIRKLFQSYESTHSDTQIIFEAIGSGSGTLKFNADKVDFLITDVPYTADKSTASLETLFIIPISLSGVAVAYNLPENPELNLNREILKRIYTGSITKWNHEAIQALNPDSNLPDLKIKTARRPFESGTQRIMSDFLDYPITDPKTIVISNTGMASFIDTTPGALGFLSFSAATNQYLKIARIENSAGQFIHPNPHVISLGKQPRTDDSDDAESPYAYPIVGFSWLVFDRDDDPMRDLARWILQTGQSYHKQFHYAPLPEALRQSMVDALSDSTDSRSPR